VNCPLARLITGEHLQRGKLQNNISLEVKIKMGPHRLKCPWTKILQNQYPNSAVCRPQKTTDRFCLSRVYTMAMVQIYRPPMWVWKVGIPLNVNIYIKRNIIWDLTMDIWGILFQTNPYTVVSIHICYVYIYDYICRYIYIYMVIRSVLLFRWSLKFDLVWSQVATSQRPQPTNYCCGQESQKCPTCPFSEYELVVLCSDFRQMIQSPVLHNSSPYKNVRWLAEEMHRWLACTRLIAKVPAGSPG